MNIYLITNRINSKQYVGRNETDSLNYFGSGKYLNRAIEKYGKENFKKEILISASEVGGREELMLLESVCILSFNTLYPNGYNLIFSDMPFPFEILSAVGKANVKLKRGWFAPGNASKGGRKVFELKIGIHAPGMRIIAGRKGGKIGGKICGQMHFENKTGLFAMTRKKKLKCCSNGGKIGGKIVGKANKRLGRGIFAPGIASRGGERAMKLHPNQASEMGKIGGKSRTHIFFFVDGLVQQTTLGGIL